MLVQNVKVDVAVEQVDLLNIFLFINKVKKKKKNSFSAEIAQARPVLHTSLMQRMTDVLSRMLNDPATRAALSGGGEDGIQGVIAGVQQADQTTNEERNIDVQSMDTETNNNQERPDNPSTDNTVQSRLDLNQGDSSVQREESAIVNNSTDSVEEASVLQDNADEGEDEEEEEDDDGENAPLPDESSQPEIAIQSHISPNSSSNKTNRDELTTNGHSTPTNIDNTRDETMMENLQDRLTSMRDGFLER